MRRTMVIEVLIKQYFYCNQRKKKKQRMSHKRKPKYLRLEEEEAILKLV